MTKRRWFFVWLFLCGMLYLFEIGADLESAHLQNLHLLDGGSYDRSTIRMEGDLKLAEQMFGPTILPNRFLAQLTAHFPSPQSPVLFNDIVAFSDSVSGTIHTVDPQWTLSGSVHILANDVSGVKSKNSGKKQGASGMAVNPKNSDELFIAQTGRRRVVAYNTVTQQTREIVSEYDGNKLNGPWALHVSSDGQYLYMTDPQWPNGVNSLPASLYRLSLNTENAQLELLSSDIQEATGFTFGLGKYANSLFVTSCLPQGQYRVSRVQLASDGSVESVKAWTETNLAMQTNDAFTDTMFGAGTEGCVSDLAMHPDGEHLIVLLPGGRLAIVDAKDGKALFVMKAADGIIFNDINFVKTRAVITSNSIVWNLRMKVEQQGFFP